MNVASITEAAISHGLKLGVQTPDVVAAARFAKRPLIDSLLTALPQKHQPQKSTKRTKDSENHFVPFVLCVALT